MSACRSRDGQESGNDYLGPNDVDRIGSCIVRRDGLNWTESVDEVGNRGSAGESTDTWAYSAFGEDIATTGTSAQPYQFAGERNVAAAGLYQNRERWLFTAAGSFASMDPLDRVTAQPYRYGSSNPVLYTDPTGREFSIVGVAATVVAVGVLSAVATEGLHRIYEFFSPRLGIRPSDGLSKTRPDLATLFYLTPENPKSFEDGVSDGILEYWLDTGGSSKAAWDRSVDVREGPSSNEFVAQDSRIAAADHYLAGRDITTNVPFATAAYYFMTINHVYEAGKALGITIRAGRFSAAPFTPEIRNWGNRGAFQLDPDNIPYWKP